MTQPAHVTLSNSLPVDARDTIVTYIKLAATLANTDLSETEVHVKQGSRYAHGLNNSIATMSGVAYFQYTPYPDHKPGAFITPVPGTHWQPSVQPGIRYLVTLKLTRDFEHGTYPYRWHYRRYKTAGACMFHDWTDELLHLAVHEFTHVAQYVNRWQRSEIHCEQTAHAVVYKVQNLLARADAARATLGRAATSSGAQTHA